MARDIVQWYSACLTKKRGRERGKIRKRKRKMGKGERKEKYSSTSANQLNKTIKYLKQGAYRGTVWQT